MREFFGTTWPSVGRLAFTCLLRLAGISVNGLVGMAGCCSDLSSLGFFITREDVWCFLVDGVDTEGVVNCRMER